MTIMEGAPAKWNLSGACSPTGQPVGVLCVGLWFLVSFREFRRAPVCEHHLAEQARRREIEAVCNALS
jgi:hypothetical protein